MHHFDQQIYQSPAYTDFVKFQGPRVALGDNGNYNPNAVYEDSEEPGLLGKDYQMLKEWVLYDTEVFSVGSLKRFTKIIQSYRYPNPIQIVSQWRYRHND